MVKPGILIVADDATLRATLARWLLHAGYAVELAESSKRAHEVAAKAAIDLAILAPQGSGVELTHELAGTVEHIILIGQPNIAVAAGEPPAPPDAWILMPLNELDVLTKVRAVLRPAPMQELQPGPQILRFDGFTLDADARTCVDAGGQEMTLTRAEFSLLLALGQKPGKVLSRDELTRVVAGRGAEPDDRSVDVLISRLRRKIEPDPKTPRLIVTVPGEGYRFTAKPQALPATNVAPAARAIEIQAGNASDTQSVPQRSRALRMFAVAAALIAILVMAVVGWKEWKNRGALQQTAEAKPPTASSAAQPSSKPSQPPSSREEQRAIVYKRMVAAMQDSQFNWRTIERLAILSGVDENEAHEILAEHPSEVVLGKSQEGKLLAKLSGH